MVLTFSRLLSFNFGSRFVASVRVTTVVGPDGPPGDELLELLADLLLDVADEQDGDGLGTKPKG